MAQNNANKFLEDSSAKSFDLRHRELDEGPVAILNQSSGTSIMAVLPFDYTVRTYYHPNNTEDLLVGTMHTHYPLTWAGANVYRNVGPSGPDNTADLPGIGYDFTKDLASGHNVITTKNFFTHDPVRRQTP